MLRKMGLIAVLMAILSLPLAAFAQDLSRSEDVNTANVAHNSFVILSEEETEVPGYVHQRYAFVSPACPTGFHVVDHYGAPIDPNDASLQIRERSMCSDLSLDTADGDYRSLRSPSPPGLHPPFQEAKNAPVVYVGLSYSR